MDPLPHRTLMPEGFLVSSSASRRVGACRRHLVVFFSRRRTYLSSLSVSWSPWVGVYHCLSRSCRSIVLMGVRRHRRRHRPRRSAVGSPRRPSSAASTNVGICARRRPLCAWRRQGRSSKRQEGQCNGISWPVVIIGLLRPGTGLGIQTPPNMGLNYEF